MSTQEKLNLFVKDMLHKHVISAQEAESIWYVSDVFILAAEQNTAEPSLASSAFRDDVTDEMHEILSLWVDWFVSASRRIS